MKFVFGIAVIFWAAGIVFSKKGRRKTRDLYGWLGLVTIWTALIYVLLIIWGVVLCSLLDQARYEFYDAADVTKVALCVVCAILIIEVVALYAVGGKKEKEEENDTAH